jgi:hypothetical protein
MPEDVYTPDGYPIQAVRLVDQTGTYSGGGSASVGSGTWTKTVIALTGASQNLLAANAARKGFCIFNRVGNAQLDVDPAGGAVAANTGITLLGGDPPLFVTGAMTPAGVITGIGTAAQSVNVWELT